MDINLLCKGCMKISQHGKCPACGFVNDEYKAPLHHLPINTILNGKYLLGKMLGEGGFGITYLGWDLLLDLKVAIKEYYPFNTVTRDHNNTNTISAYSGESLELFTTGKEKFINEAKSLAKFYSLPSIVAVKDFFSENGTAYIVMEFVDGMTLKEHLTKSGGSLPAKNIFEVINPLIRSLIEVHKTGTIHRDISPDNIMIDTSGNVKLLDFGSARDITTNGRSLSILLKPGYAPEEQYRTRGHQGPWTDVYAMCATIYRAITGQPPMESLERLREDCLIPLKTFSVSISPAQEYALMKGLSVIAKDRWQDMEQFYQALYSQTAHDSFVKNPPVAAVQLTQKQSEYAEKIEESYNANGAGAPTPPQKQRKKQGKASSIVVSALLICATFSVVFFGIKLLERELEISVFSGLWESSPSISESPAPENKPQVSVSTLPPVESAPPVPESKPESIPEPPQDNSSGSVEGEEIVWQDKAMEAYIREALEIYTEPITVQDVSSIVELEISSKDDNYISIDKGDEVSIEENIGKIESLEDIQHFTDLYSLTIESQSITDVSPLADSIYLMDINLSHNYITDITPLENLINLERLLLLENEISDITPLANLTNLDSLDLGYNQIIDISALSSLTNMAYLRLDHNQIEDVMALESLVNLKELYTDGNLIGDFSALENIENLEMFLRH